MCGHSSTPTAARRCAPAVRALQTRPPRAHGHSHAGNLLCLRWAARKTLGQTATWSVAALCTAACRPRGARGNKEPQNFCVQVACSPKRPLDGFFVRRRRALCRHGDTDVRHGRHVRPHRPPHVHRLALARLAPVDVLPWRRPRRRSLHAHACGARRVRAQNRNKQRNSTRGLKHCPLASCSCSS